MELRRNRRDCFPSIRANSRSPISSVWIAIIHSLSDFHLGMAPWPWTSWGGGASAGRPFSFELKTLGEKVCYCQSLPSDLVLYLGASFSVYWWVQSLQDIQDGLKFIWSHRCFILMCHPSTVAIGDTFRSGWAIRNFKFSSTVIHYESTAFR